MCSQHQEGALAGLCCDETHRIFAQTPYNLQIMQKKRICDKTKNVGGSRAHETGRDRHVVTQEDKKKTLRTPRPTQFGNHTCAGGAERNFGKAGFDCQLFVVSGSKEARQCLLLPHSPRREVSDQSRSSSWGSDLESRHLQGAPPMVNGAAVSILDHCRAQRDRSNGHTAASSAEAQKTPRFSLCFHAKAMQALKMLMAVRSTMHTRVNKQVAK